MRGPAPPASVKFTYEDFVNFPNDGKRHEIIDGEHYVTPSPNTKHQRTCTRLTYALAVYLNQNPVLEHWVIDPELETVKIYQRDDYAFVRVAELSAEHEDVLATPLLLDFSVTLAAIFAPPI